MNDLGLDSIAHRPAERRVEGIVENVDVSVPTRVDEDCHHGEVPDATRDFGESLLLLFAALLYLERAKVGACRVCVHLWVRVAFPEPLVDVGDALVDGCTVILVLHLHIVHRHQRQVGLMNCQHAPLMLQRGPFHVILGPPRQPLLPTGGIFCTGAMANGGTTGLCHGADWRCGRMGALEPERPRAKHRGGKGGRRRTERRCGFCVRTAPLPRLIPWREIYLGGNYPHFTKLFILLFIMPPMSP